MGGPSRESYLAAMRQRQARRDALRTRGGVIALDEWRDGLRAVAALERLLHDPPWLLGIRLGVARDVGLELTVKLLQESRQARVCLPCHVNEIPVRIEVRNAGGAWSRDA